MLRALVVRSEGLLGRQTDGSLPAVHDRHDGVEAGTAHHVQVAQEGGEQWAGVRPGTGDDHDTLRRLSLGDETKKSGADVEAEGAARAAQALLGHPFDGLDDPSTGRRVHGLRRHDCHRRRRVAGETVEGLALGRGRPAQDDGDGDLGAHHAVSLARLGTTLVCFA